MQLCLDMVSTLPMTERNEYAKGTHLRGKEKLALELATAIVLRRVAATDVMKRYGISVNEIQHESRVSVRHVMTALSAQKHCEFDKVVALHWVPFRNVNCMHLNEDATPAQMAATVAKLTEGRPPSRRPVRAVQRDKAPDASPPRAKRRKTCPRVWAGAGRYSIRKFVPCVRSSLSASRAVT